MPCLFNDFIVAIAVEHWPGMRTECPVSEMINSTHLNETDLRISIKRSEHELGLSIHSLFEGINFGLGITSFFIWEILWRWWGCRSHRSFLKQLLVSKVECSFSGA